STCRAGSQLSWRATTLPPGATSEDDSRLLQRCLQRCTGRVNMPSDGETSTEDSMMSQLSRRHLLGLGGLATAAATGALVGCDNSQAAGPDGDGGGTIKWW